MRFVNGKFDEEGSLPVARWRAGPTTSGRSLPRIPPPLRGGPRSPTPVWSKTPGHPRKPFGTTSTLGPELQADLLTVLEEDQDPQDRPLPRQGAGDGHHLPPTSPALRGTGLEPQLRSFVQMTMARTLGRGPRPLLWGSSDPRRGPDHHAPGAGPAAPGGPERGTSMTRSGPKLRLFEAIRSADPAKCVRGPVQRLPGHPDVADEPRVETSTPRWSWRSTTGAGRVPSTCGPAEPAGQAHRGPGGLQEAAPHRVGMKSQKPPQTRWWWIDPVPGRVSRHKAAGIEDSRKRTSTTLREPGSRTGALRAPAR